ncbi:MAG: hypothetical protein H6656_15600 [Ardenticatenaceae bacterium]|nr:hypothetical protein [Ardenticatenaceae bacterium]
MAEAAEKLTIEAQICITCGDVRETAVSRGMSICSSSGEVVGQVAAVLLDGRSQQPTHLVLTRLVPEHRLVPLSQIVGVNQACVLLDITNQQLNQLPLHTPKP